MCICQSRFSINKIGFYGPLLLFATCITTLKKKRFSFDFFDKTESVLSSKFYSVPTSSIPVWLCLSIDSNTQAIMLNCSQSDVNKVIPADPQWRTREQMTGWQKSPTFFCLWMEFHNIFFISSILHDFQQWDHFCVHQKKAFKIGFKSASTRAWS